MHSVRVDDEKDNRKQEVDNILKHSNELVERYRKLVNLKEKELKKKDKKI